MGSEILPKHPEVKLARVGRNFGQALPWLRIYELISEHQGKGYHRVEVSSLTVFSWKMT